MKFPVATARFGRNTGKCKQCPALASLRTGLLAAVATVTLLAASRAQAQKIGFVWNNNPTESGTTVPSSGYSYNSSGHAVSITRHSKGSYTVDFAGLGNALYSDAQVNGYGSGSDFCNVEDWGSSNNTDVEIDVLCYTKSGSLTDHSFTLLYQARKKSDATRPEVAFVWANAPTKSSYTPNGEYSYNESGGTNTIKRSSKGNYAVYLPGFATTHSTVMVGAYGAPAHCQVSDWGSYGSGTVVNVNCTDTEGVFEDEYFDLVYSTDLTAGYGADSDGGGAILAYDDTERSYYDVSDSQSISIDGEPMYAKSTGTGQYVWAMTVEPMWKASNVIVTAYDSPGTYCNTNNWESDPTNTYVYVSCFNHNGEPANTQFTATFQLGAPTKAESE